MKLPAPVLFDWDKGNIDKNWRKHKVHFKEAEEVFQNKPLKIFPDRQHSVIEKRFQALGITDSRRNLSVVFTVRNKQLRVISVRDQNKKERRQYAKKEKT